MAHSTVGLVDGGPVVWRHVVSRSLMRSLVVLCRSTIRPLNEALRSSPIIRCSLKNSAANALARARSVSQMKPISCMVSTFTANMSWSNCSTGDVPSPALGRAGVWVLLLAVELEASAVDIKILPIMG